MSKMYLKELVKKGCIRNESRDYTGRGLRYKFLKYEDLDICYIKDGEEYNLWVEIPSDEDNFIYYDYCEEEWYKNCFRYDGCYEIDVDDFIGICKVAKEKIEELRNRPKEVIDTSKMEERRLYEIENTKKIIEEVKNSNLIWELDDWEASRMLDYMRSLINEVKRVEELDFSKEDYRDLRSDRRRFEEYGYIYIKDDDFYIRELKEMIELNKEEK